MNGEKRDRKTYEPFISVFLRSLAWERFVAHISPNVGDSIEYLQRVRYELGMPKYAEGKGGPHYQIQNLRTKLNLGKSAKPWEFVQEKDWRNHWSMLYLPSHLNVRRHSASPILAEKSLVSGDPTKFKISFRNSALPQLETFVGTKKLSSSKKLENEKWVKDGRRGLYFMRTEKALYLGQTTEFVTRLREHTTRRRPEWWCFFAPIDGLSLDTLDAAEALLIGFWNEVCHVENKQRGCDQAPEFHHLQEALLLVEAASATLLWIIREGYKEIQVGIEPNIPFKGKSAYDWPDCYLLRPEN